jgi:hypothetical protein
VAAILGNPDAGRPDRRLADTGGALEDKRARAGFEAFEERGDLPEFGVASHDRGGRSAHWAFSRRLPLVGASYLAPAW